MKYNFIKSIFKQTTVLEREKYKDINHLLDDDTKYFLYELGLPGPNYIGFDFINADNYNHEHNMLCIGNNGRKSNGEISSYICINLNNNEIVMFYNFTDDVKYYLGSSLKNFIFTLFEFEMFIREICIKEYFGDRYSLENRKVYLEYLSYRLFQIDQDFYSNDRDYYWGSILEGMETGFVRIV